MKRTFVLFLIFLPLFAFTAAHKFYVSVTNIEHNEKNKSLEVISHVFIDDLEKLLKERYDPGLFLLKDGEHPQAEKFIEGYLNDKFKILVNSKEVTLNYLGKEYDNDEVLLYIEVSNVDRIQSISVENGILTDLFPEQKNVIKVEYDGVIKTLLLSRSEINGTIKFSN